MSPHLRNPLAPLVQCLSLELSSFFRPHRQRQGAGWSLWQGTITRKQEGELEGEEALQHCKGNSVLGFLDMDWFNFLTLQTRQPRPGAGRVPLRPSAMSLGCYIILGAGEGAQ